jgi:hypothetical protein
MMQRTTVREPMALTLAASQRVRYPGVGTLILVSAFIGAATSLRNFDFIACVQERIHLLDRLHCLLSAVGNPYCAGFSPGGTLSAR